MSALNETIRRDLTRKIEGRLEEIMRQELTIAQIALPSTEVVLIYLQIAAAFSGCAIGTAVGNRKPGVQPQDLYDDCADALHRSVLRRRDDVLTALQRLEAQA